MKHDSNFNGWRAVGHTPSGIQHLLYVGTSSEQVKKNYPGSFYDLLLHEEQLSIVRISIEKWHGSKNRGYWTIQENSRVPRVHRYVN